MEYLAVIGWILAGIGSTIAAASIATAKMKDTAIDGLTLKLKEKDSAAEAAHASVEVERARLEKAISTLKAEITILEGDLNACRNPDAVRARLRGLLNPVP